MFHFQKNNGQHKQNEEYFTVKLHNKEIAYLEFKAEQEKPWHFYYSQDDNTLSIPGFPHKDREYYAKELWPFFLIRIPSLSNPYVQKRLKMKKIEKPDEATMLKLFGHKSIANPFELDTNNGKTQGQISQQQNFA